MGVDRVDDAHTHAGQLAIAIAVEVRCVPVGNEVPANGQAATVNPIGQFGAGLAAAPDVVLDAEITLDAAGVVAGRQQEATLGILDGDQVAGGRGGEDAAAADDRLGNAIGRRHAQQDRDGFTIVITAVAADNDAGTPKGGQLVEDRLQEILEISGFPEALHRLSQAGGPGPLIIEGNRRHLPDGQGFSPADGGLGPCVIFETC
jgi:hypothetical protein